MNKTCELTIEELKMLGFLVLFGVIIYGIFKFIFSYLSLYLLDLSFSRLLIYHLIAVALISIINRYIGAFLVFVTILISICGISNLWYSAECNYINGVIKKYDLTDYLDEDEVYDKLYSSTLGFEICYRSDYGSPLCSDYLNYFEKELIKVKNEVILRKEKDEKKFEEAGKRLHERLRNQNNNIDKHFNEKL